MTSVVYIIWLRQLRRHFRAKSRVIGSLVQPMLFLVALGFGFGPIFEKAGEGDYIQFLVPGIIAMSILFTAIFSGIEVVWDKQFGFLKETLVAPVSRIKIVIGKVLGGATVAAIQGVIVLLLSLLIGFRVESWWLLPVAVLVMLLVASFFAAVGIAIASRLEDMQGFSLIMNFLIMPIFLLSGALFPVDSLPKALGVVTSLDPLAYGVDGLRGALSGMMHYGWTMDFTVLAIILAVMLVIGSWLFRKIEI